MLPILDYIKEEKSKVIFIDEPEAGISLQNQYILWKAFNKAANNDCQLFIFTHSYIFIYEAKDVFDMGAKKWVDSKEYLKQFTKL